MFFRLFNNFPDSYIQNQMPPFLPFKPVDEICPIKKPAPEPGAGFYQFIGTDPYFAISILLVSVWLPDMILSRYIPLA